MGGHRLFGGSVVWKHLRSCYTVRADVTDRSHCGVHHVTQQHALAAPCPPFYLSPLLMPALKNSGLRNNHGWLFKVSTWPFDFELPSSFDFVYSLISQESN